MGQTNAHMHTWLHKFSQQMGTLQASYCGENTRKMLMSIHCRAQSQRNRGNELIFLASMLSKVTAMPRNEALASRVQQCLSLGLCLSASCWLSRCSPLPSLKLLANMCKYWKFPLCRLFLLRASYTTKCHNMILILDLQSGENFHGQFTTSHFFYMIEQGQSVPYQRRRRKKEQGKVETRAISCK